MLDKKEINKIKAHAISEYPREACGIVVSDEYIPCLNYHPQPKEFFRLDPNIWVQYPNIQAVIHSHTNNKFWPSAVDMEGQINTGLPWGLLHTDGETTSDILFWGNGVEPPPLLGRQFRWGPSGSDGKGDCYALIKDYYKLEKNIELSEYPRDPGWWNTGGSMYTDYFKREGFIEIARTEVQPGDCMLLQWMGKSPHHAAIYLGKNLMLHHLSDRLSRRDIIGQWTKYITHYLRYNK